MASAPQVSVVIAAFEAEGFIASAVKSALAQTVADIEVIIVDDASGDGTLSAAQAAAGGDARVRTIRLAANGGPSAARNAGFEAAAGAWIAVLDADDAMAPERIEKLLRFAEAEQADIVADALTVVEQGAADKTFACALASPVRLADYARDNRMFRRSGGSGYLKPMFQREFLVRNRLSYDATLRIAEDWTLAAEALACGARFSLMREPLYRYAVHAGSISARLSVKKLEPMLASADRMLAAYASRLSTEDRAALEGRRASLVDALAFQTFVERAKAKDFGGAVAALLKRPSSWPLLRMPIAARLKGTRGARETFG